MRGRFFLGLPLEPGDATALADEVRQALGGARAEEHFRLARAEGLHLTLLFLGELAAGPRAALEAALRGPLARLPTPRLWLDRPGSFPEMGPARVLWMGVRGEGSDDGARLLALRAAVLAGAEGAGLDLARERAEPFRPHVTVARPRGRVEPPPAFAELRPARVRVGGPVTLFESLRASGASRYVARARFGPEEVTRPPGESGGRCRELHPEPLFQEERMLGSW